MVLYSTVSSCRRFSYIHLALVIELSKEKFEVLFVALFLVTTIRIGTIGKGLLIDVEPFGECSLSYLEECRAYNWV